MVFRVGGKYVPHWREIGMQIGRMESLFPLWKRHIRCNDNECDGLEDQVVLRDRRQSVNGEPGNVETYTWNNPYKTVESLELDTAEFLDLIVG